MLTRLHDATVSTLQEEFEGAAQARAALETITDPNEREAAERKVKLRTMGNIRLIGELYKTKMIVERILHRCVCSLASDIACTPNAAVLGAAVASASCLASRKRTRLKRTSRCAFTVQASQPLV